MSKLELPLVLVAFGFGVTVFATLLAGVVDALAADCARGMVKDGYNVR